MADQLWLMTRIREEEDRRCADDFVAFDNKQHETVRTVRHNQTINFFWPSQEGPEIFFPLASLANTGPPLAFL